MRLPCPSWPALHVGSRLEGPEDVAPSRHALREEKFHGHFMVPPFSGEILRLLRTSSSSNSPPSSLTSWGVNAKRGSLALRTKLFRACSLKQLWTVLSCLPSSAVRSPWQLQHRGWKHRGARRSSCLRGATWSHSKSPFSKMPPHRARRLSSLASSSACSFSMGALRFALSRDRKNAEAERGQPLSGVLPCVH